MAGIPKQEERQKVTAPELLLKIVLSGTQTHYQYPGMIDEIRLEHMLHCGKQILYKSHQESDVRSVKSQCLPRDLGFRTEIQDTADSMSTC